MKKSPQMQRLEEMLHSGKIVAGGFMGGERRDLTEMIDRDMASLASLGYTVSQLAQRMHEITDKAKEGLGTEVNIDDHTVAMVAEAKGLIICPWPHPARFDKRVTQVRNTRNGLEIAWTDLSIHMIAEHEFFEGKGSTFRIEPELLVNVIFGH